MAAETKTTAESCGETIDITILLRFGLTLMAIGFVGLGGFGSALGVRIPGDDGVIMSGVNIGVTTAELFAFDPGLSHYIAHLHIAVAGMVIGLAILSLAIIWYGARRGPGRTWTESVMALVGTTAVSVPMHSSGAFHIEQLRHLRSAYEALVVFVVGTIIAFRGFEKHVEL